MSYLHTSADCAEHHDLVRDFADTRPEIVVLCGSTRFGEHFRAANLHETLAGRIVLSIGCDTKSDVELASAGITFDQALKNRLDDLHKRKIDLADRVIVLNIATPEYPGGYIGDSTRSEIEYAEKLGKRIDYWEPGTAETTAAASEVQS